MSTSLQPNWQVDIPGLAQLVMKMGARGLKELALTGVDPHTIGCLYAIGDLSPVCNDYRKKLNIQRQKQRKNRRFIYQAIEISASINFLADELLKTRAGENAIALFSSMIPILSESQYTDALLTLFSQSKIEADSTPGVGQLQRLRSALFPLATAMDIKNKVLQYHLLFTQYNDQFPEPCHAIPSAESMAKIVLILRKMCCSDEPYQLQYKGIQGAAWTAAYAGDILGMKICIVAQGEERPKYIPISALFEDAQVLFYITDESGQIELHKSGSIEDLIRRTSVDAADIQWTIDCDSVIFITAQHPGIREHPIFSALSIFATAKALDMVAEISRDLSYSVNKTQSRDVLPEGLISYQKSVLPCVQQRCIQILNLLGFAAPDYHEFDIDSDGNTSGLKHQHALRHRQGCNKKAGKVVQYWDLPRSTIGQAWWPPHLEDGFRQYLNSWIDTIDEDKHALPEVSILLRTVKNAVLFASYLSFTDWHMSLRRMSANFFATTAVLDGGSGGNINSKNRMKFIQQFCTAHPAPEPLFWSFGQELNGLVLLRQIPLIQSISDLEGVVISFQPGTISFEGERCSEICLSGWTSSTTFGGISSPSPKYRPYHIDSNLQLVSQCRLAGGNVYLTFEVRQYTGDGATPGRQLSPSSIPLNPERVAETLSELLVTTACSHLYLSPLSPEMSDKYEWHEGLILSVNETVNLPEKSPQQATIMTKHQDEIKSSVREMRKVIYQVVDQDHLGQWLACSFLAAEDVLFVMQKEACLDCTLDRVQRHFQINDKYRDVCIITGGIPKEARRSSVNRKSSF